MFRITRFPLRGGAARVGLAPILLAITLSGSVVQAASTPPIDPASSTQLPPYETLDSNKDGIVTLPEVVVFSPSLAKRIAHCDSDHNKALSREEYAACHPKPAAKAAVRPVRNSGG